MNYTKPLWTAVPILLLLSVGYAAKPYKGPREAVWSLVIDSTPTGAEVFWRNQYDDASKLVRLGTTPISNAQIPIRIGKDGYFPSIVFVAKHGKVSSEYMQEGAVMTDRPAGIEWLNSFPKALVLKPYKAYEFEALTGYAVMLEVLKNPEGSWNKKITSFRGRVIHIRESQSGTLLQLAIEKFGSPTTFKMLVVYWREATMPNVVEGSFVTILGRIEGIVDGKNSYGGQVEAVGFQAIAYCLFPSGYSTCLNTEQERYDKWKAGTLFER